MLCEWCVNLSETVSNGLQLLIMRSVQLLCFHVADKHTKYPLIRAVGWQQHGAKGNYRGDTLIIASWSPNHLSRLAASSGGPHTSLLQGNLTRSQPKDKIVPEYGSSAAGSPPRRMRLPSVAPWPDTPTTATDSPRGGGAAVAPAEETHSSCSCPWPCSFGHRPRLMTTDEGLQYCIHCENLSIYPLFHPPSLVSQILGYLNSTLSSDSSDPLWNEALRMRPTLKGSLQQ